MAFSSGNSSISLEDILSKVSEFDIVHHYFGVNEVPCVMSSPLRLDNKPSFGLYTLDGKKIYWNDLAHKTKGGLWDLLGDYWGLNYKEVLTRVYEDIPKFTTTHTMLGKTAKVQTIKHYSSDTDLKCRIREWRAYDLKYWGSFGITIEWLQYADVYPISHKIVIKEGQTYTFVADKYAYAYVERKDNKVTLKIYQPFNKAFKWSNKHNRSVISLWTKVPDYGDSIIICASMKDALCVWINTGIPCIAIQGEGYSVSNTVINELKRRYKQVYILLDNDDAGIKDGIKLSEETGFTNLVLPDYGAKDCSDLFKLLEDKEKFREVILTLIKEKNIKQQF